MKSNQVFELTNAELVAKVMELKSELFFLRFKNETNQLSNPMVIAECKKDIARVKTIIRQRELGISQEPTKVVKATKSRKKAKE